MEFAWPSSSLLPLPAWLRFSPDSPWLVRSYWREWLCTVLDGSICTTIAIPIRRTEDQADNSSSIRDASLPACDCSSRCWFPGSDPRPATRST